MNRDKRVACYLLAALAYAFAVPNECIATYHLT